MRIESHSLSLSRMETGSDLCRYDRHSHSLPQVQAVDYSERFFSLDSRYVFRCSDLYDP